MTKFTYEHKFSYADMETKCRIYMGNTEIDLEDAAKLLNAKDQRIAELEKERDELSKFADWVLEAAVTGSDICGGEAQDKMFDLGILTREIYDPEIHTLQQGSECEEGDYIYFRAPKEQGE